MSNDPSLAARSSHEATPTGSFPESKLPGAAAVRLEEGASPVDGFFLEHRLGRGGFGEVWQALGPGGFRVAMKFIRMDESAGHVELRSLELTKQIKHPNLLAQFGAWQRGGYLIIAMELGNGTLYERLKSESQRGGQGLPRDELLEYMREAAKAIDYLNGLSIQHRDIKPQNLLLVGTGVKVADFGLAKLLEQSVGAASGSMTPAYAAPEFFNGQATKWSDQYCLAVSYCQLRGNALPFSGNAAQIVAGHLTREPDLAMLAPEERPIVARALAKDPHQRWPSCILFVEALQSVNATQPAAYYAPLMHGTPPGHSTTGKVPQGALATATPPAGPPPLPPTPSRRKPAPAAKTGVLALVLVGALLLGGVAGVGLLWWASGRQHEPQPTSLASRETAANHPRATGAATPASVAPTSRSTAPSPQPSQAIVPPGLLLPMLPPTTLEAGKSIRVSIKVARMNCPGPIELRLSNLPQGVSARSVTLPAEQETVIIELQAKADATLGRKRVHLLAAAGTVQASMPFMLVVSRSTAARAALQFRLLPTLMLQAGEVASTVVRLERTHCPGEVRLRWEGLPAGVTASPNVLPASADYLTVTLRGALGAKVGAHPVRVIADHPLADANTNTVLVVLPYLAKDDQRTIPTLIGPRHLALSYDASSQQTLALVLECAGGGPRAAPLHLGSGSHIVRACPKGRRFAIRTVPSVGQDSEIRTVDALTGRQVGATLKVSDRVREFGFAPDGQQLFTATAKELACWEVLSGKVLWRIARSTDLLRMIVSPDGKRLAAIDLRHKLCAWDALTGKELYSVDGEVGAPTCLVFSPDLALLAVSGRQNKAAVFDAETGKRLSILSHTGTVNWADFSPDGKMLATVSADRTARTWNPRSGALLQTLQHDLAVYRCEFTKDGQQLITSETLLHHLWDLRTGKRETSGVTRQILFLVGPYSAKGKHAVIRSFLNTARIWDLESRQAVTPPMEHPDWVGLALFSPDGRALLTACRDGSTRVWDAATGRPQSPFRRHSSTVTRAQFSPDNGTVATVSRETNQTHVKVWSARTGNTVVTIPDFNPQLNDIAFSPDSTRLVLLAGDRSVTLWDLKTGKQVWRSFVPQSAFRISFSPDGKQVHVDFGPKFRLDADTGKNLATEGKT